MAERGPGRPPAIIDWDYVGKLLEAGCPATDIAAEIGIHRDSFYKRCEADNNVTFSTFAQEKRTKGDNLLRAAQYKNAMNGNTSMQIWLGKNRLGQSDKQEEEKEPPNSNLIELQNRLMEMQALLLKHGVHHKPEAESKLPGSDPQV